MENQPVYLVGNAHIDPVWLWRWQEGLAEIKATFRSALDRMNEFPDYIFTSACAAYYQWVEENDPAMFAEITERIKEGRWCIAGGMWVQPDCNIPSAESFARHFLYSQRYFESRFGRIAKTGYNVDSFGHNGMLPQLLRKGGLTGYVFMRPAQTEKELAHHLFAWQSPDGSSIATFRLANNYGDWIDKELLAKPEYSGMSRYAVKILQVQEEAGRENIPMMCFYGVGNHGGGPTISALNDITHFIASHEEIRFSDPDRYFADVPDADALPVLLDDLQHHASGCYSAHSGIKQANRHAELALVSAEKWMSATHALGFEGYNGAGIQEAWKLTLFNQFHDILAGCSIRSACEDALRSFGESISRAGRLENAALQRISWNIDTSDGIEPVRSKEGDWILWENGERGAPLVVFNPHAFPVTYPVRMNKQLSRLEDMHGNALPLQLTRAEYTNSADRWNTVAMIPLPAFGYTTCRMYLNKEDDCAAAASVDVGEHSLENTLLRAEFDPDTGALARLFDKRTGREVLKTPSEIEVLDETPYDTWCHNVFRFDTKLGRFGAPVFKKVEMGAVRGVLRVTMHYEDTIVKQDYILYPDCGTLFMRVAMDVRAQHKMMRFTLGANVTQPRAVYALPGGHMVKKADGNENPAQQWAAVADTDGYGVAMIGCGKYSFRSDGANLGMMLVRTPQYADHYGERDGESAYMDQGEQSFLCAVMPFSLDDAAAVAHTLALMETAPVCVMETYHKGSLAREFSLLDIDCETVLCQTVKRAENGNGYVVRCTEHSGKSQDMVCIRFAGRTYQTCFGAHEIKTVFFPDDPMMDISEIDFLERDMGKRSN